MCLSASPIVRSDHTIWIEIDLFWKFCVRACNSIFVFFCCFNLIRWHWNLYEMEPCCDGNGGWWISIHLSCILVSQVTIGLYGPKKWNIKNRQDFFFFLPIQMKMGSILFIDDNTWLIHFPFFFNYLLIQMNEASIILDFCFSHTFALLLLYSFALQPFLIHSNKLLNFLVDKLW